MSYHDHSDEARALAAEAERVKRQPVEDVIFADGSLNKLGTAWQRALRDVSMGNHGMVVLFGSHKAVVSADGRPISTVEVEDAMFIPNFVGGSSYLSTQLLDFYMDAKGMTNEEKIAFEKRIVGSGSVYATQHDGYLKQWNNGIHIASNYSVREVGSRRIFDYGTNSQTLLNRVILSQGEPRRFIKGIDFNQSPPQVLSPRPQLR